MQIKEIAEKLQITPRAIRFYEKKGLIQLSKRKDNDYREFSEQDAWRLQLIIALREVGISVGDIKEILHLLDHDSHQDVLKLLDFQRYMLYSQWSELKQLIQTMDQMISVLERKQALAWEDIIKLADGSKRLRDIRHNWQDRWNYDQQAEIHDEIVYNPKHEFNAHPNYEHGLNSIVSIISPIEGEKGLDIGAGTGNLAHLFVQQQVSMSAIDQSREMLAKCKEKNPQIETKLGNFLSIPYLDQSFDFVVSSYAFHHLDEEQKIIAIDEMKRVLKRSGRMALLDLMYLDVRDKENIHSNLLQNGQEQLLQLLESKCCAYRATLLEQLKEKGFSTRSIQLDNILHLIYAEVPLGVYDRSL